MSQIKLSENFIKSNVKLALNEDLYPSGDITSGLIKENKIIGAKLVSNQDAVIGGLLFVKYAFLLIDKINKLRLDLIKEELTELTEAMNNKDLLEVADALTDILYVTYGAGHAFGIDLDKCFDEVQNSNMSKLDENGKPIYNENGKVMKGPNYFKPDLSKFVN